MSISGQTSPVSHTTRPYFHSWRACFEILLARPGVQGLLFFMAVTGLMFYPLWPDFFSKLAATGDAYEYVWKLWWFKHALLETGQSFWVVPAIYYPHGYLLAYGETTFANTALALPFTCLWGEVTAYNSLVILSTLLSGFGMFLLARQVTGSQGAGLLAGVIFAFAPFRRLQMLHLNIFTTQWLPLFFYFLERFARSRKPGYGLPIGLFFALNALGSWYYAAAGTLFGGIWVLVRCRPLASYLRQRQTWQALGLAAGVVAVLVVPLALPSMAVSGSADAAIPMANSNYFAATPLDYLIPSPYQFWWGNWVAQHLLVRQPDPGEFIMGLGFVAWLFGLYGLRLAPRHLTRPWLVVTLVAMVLSFGLTLHLTGRQVVIPAPPGLSATFNRMLDTISQHYALKPEPFTLGQPDGLVIPMPALLLRWFMPALGELRTWTRFGVITLFGMAMLAAVGAATWYRREVIGQPWRGPAGRPRLKHRLAWAGVVGLALFELWWQPLPPATPVLRRPVDTWLAGQPGSFAIMEYPLDSAFSAQQLIYTWAHGKPIVHGYATYFSFVFSRQQPELLDFPGQASLKQLAGWGVRYVLVETAAPYTAEAQRILAAISREPCLQQRTRQGSVLVFELVDCASGLDQGGDRP